jgi:phage baseplate assembly protein gpV
MKIKFTYAGALVLLTSLFSTALSAQNHYRTIADGNWTATNVWEASADGISGWAATATAPITSDLTIQVRNNITVNSNITADQLTVTNTGHLTVTGTTGVLQLANGTGDDLTVNGTLQMDNFPATAINGPGNIVIAGTLTWIGGAIAAPSVINSGGQANLSGNNIKYLQTTLVNNGTFNWSTGASSGGIYMNNATFTNNGTINENFSSGRGFFNDGGTNQFTNNGTFHKQTTQVFNNLTVPFTNSATGILSGTGTFNLTNTVSNLGRIRPGNSPGLLTVSSGALNNQATTIDLEILNNSGAGTGYDQLTITGGTPNLSNAIINVLDISPGNNPAPLGNYNNLISGSFTALNSANVNVRTNYSKAATTTTALAVQKVALFPLPVVWGEFNAVAKNNEVVLNWETLSEENTASFVIEHAAGNNSGYTPVATIAAQGNSNSIKKYEYRFNSPDKEKSNFFRIKQVDLDGKSKYSDVRIVKFNKGNIVKVSTYPNPVISELNINVQVSNIAVSLSDMYGKTILTTLLKAGTNTINMQPYAKGYYLVGIYEDGVLLETKKVVKQ